MKKIIIFAAFFSLFFINSVSAAEFNANLKYGSKGNDVIKLQEFLNEQGLYNGPITGNFFSLTLKAVKALQTREAISPVSGFFGNLTRAKVNEILDTQLVDSEAEAVSEPVAVVPDTSLGEVVAKLNDQNKLLQDSLNLQRAEADRLRAIADAAEVKAQAELQVKQAQEAANTAAMARSEQQIVVNNTKPLYTSSQLKDKYLNYTTGGRDVLLFIHKSPLTQVWSDKQIYTGSPDGEASTVIGWTFDISFSRSGSSEAWGDAIVVFNGKTVLDKNGLYFANELTNLSAKPYSYQIIYPSPGREDSVYEGTI